MTDWQRPPFAEDNLVALKHGAYSLRIVAANTPPEVQALIEAIATLPQIAEPDLPLVEGLARKLVQRRQVWGHLDRLGGSLIDARGRPRGCWRLLMQLDHGIREDCKVLALGPAVRAQLVGDLAAAQASKSTAAAQDRLRQRAAEREGNQ